MAEAPGPHLDSRLSKYRGMAQAYGLPRHDRYVRRHLHRRRTHESVDGGK